MATYDYECKKCNNTIEIQRSMSEQATEVICECGETRTRVWTAPPIKFNASGFYSTDN